MSVSSIGIQMILPNTGVTPKSPTPPPGRDRDGGEAVVAVDAVVRQAPPPPGMGKKVDKSA
jgi:hypothetical protein